MNKILFDYYMKKFKDDIKDADLKKGEENKLKLLIKKLNDNSGVFKDFPYEQLKMEEKAKLLNYLLNITPERQIVSNIGKDDVDRNFENFLIETDTDIFFIDRINDTFIKNIEILSLNNRDLIRNCNDLEYILSELKKTNKLILKEIFREINDFKNLGIKYDNVNHISSYIDYVSDAILQYIVYKVIINPNTIHIKEIFKVFLEKLDQLTCSIDKQIERKRKKQQENYSLTSNTTTSYFVKYRGHFSRYYEELDILNNLYSEIKGNKSLFCPVKEEYIAEKILLSEEEIKESFKIISEELSVYDYEKKIKETREIINIMQIHGQRNCSPNCLQDIKVYFREIYLSKSKYKEKQTMAIIRDYLEMIKYENMQAFEKKAHYMFFREKISRGYFREKNLLDLYIKKIEVHNKIYNLLLKNYLFYDFSDSVESINSINEELITTFQYNLREFNNK